MMTFLPCQRGASFRNAATATPAAPSITQCSVSNISRMARRISSSLTSTPRSITRRQKSKVTEPASSPPAVLSDSVGRSSTSTMLPACKHWCITGEFSGQQPTISVSGETAFRYSPMPPISPPPPTATKTASGCGNCGGQRIFTRAVKPRAHRLNAPRLEGRDMRGDEHLRRDAARARCGRYPQPVIPVAGRDYARRGLFRRQQRDLIRRATELEGAGVLPVFQLEVSAQFRRVLQRRLAHERCDAVVSGENFVFHGIALFYRRAFQYLRPAPLRRTVALADHDSPKGGVPDLLDR